MTIARRGHPHERQSMDSAWKAGIHSCSRFRGLSLRSPTPMDWIAFDDCVAVGVAAAAAEEMDIRLWVALLPEAALS